MFIIIILVLILIIVIAFFESSDELVDEEESKKNRPSVLEIGRYPKEAIINMLIGKEFIYNGKKCKMEHGNGYANTVWVIKNDWFGTHVIQAHKLYKHELIQIYNQVYD